MDNTFICQIEGDEPATIHARYPDHAAMDYVRGGDWSAEEGGWPGHGVLPVWVWRADKDGRAIPETRETVRVTVTR